MDGKRICRLVDRRYPVLDREGPDDVTPLLLAWELVPLSFVELRNSIHEYLEGVTPPTS